ncbi:hypothetical protein CJO80_27095 (plasmid) [Ralstonia solanacearum]|nr:hypothetical protein CJO80_27095 [Ralstonia solanacearum]
MTQPPNITMHRDLAGTRIEGTRYVLRLHPSDEWQTDGDPSLLVSVVALPTDGSEHGIDLTYDATRAFALQDIELVATKGGDELRCLRATAARSGAPAFREGFVLALEPGMAAYLPATLQRLDQVSRQAAPVRAAAAAQLGRRLLPSEDSAVLEVVAMLAEYGTVEDALRFAFNYQGDRLFGPNGDHPNYADLGAALRHADVAAVLDQVAAALCGASPA